MGERLDRSGAPHLRMPQRRDVVEWNRGDEREPRAGCGGPAGHGASQGHRSVRRPGVAVGAGAARVPYLTDRGTIPGGRVPSVAGGPAAGDRRGTWPSFRCPDWPASRRGSAPGCSGNAFCIQRLQFALPERQKC